MCEKASERQRDFTQILSAVTDREFAKPVSTGQKTLSEAFRRVRIHSTQLQAERVLLSSQFRQLIVGGFMLSKDLPVASTSALFLNLVPNPQGGLTFYGTFCFGLRRLRRPNFQLFFPDVHPNREAIQKKKYIGH